jgi:hypothetical protein
MVRQREEFVRSHDIAPLVMAGLSCASAILAHAADWVGHRDGLPDGESFAGDDLPDQLRVHTLDAWLELFGRDLKAVYDTPDGRLDLQRALALGRHAERILWALGVLPWPEDGSIRWAISEPGPVLALA